MPLYRATETGELITRSERYVSAFPDGAFVLIDGESPEEMAERLHAEALANKVDLELFDEVNEDTPAYTDSGDDLEGDLDAN